MLNTLHYTKLNYNTFYTADSSVVSTFDSTNPKIKVHDLVAKPDSSEKFLGVTDEDLVASSTARVDFVSRKVDGGDTWGMPHVWFVGSMGTLLTIFERTSDIWGCFRKARAAVERFSQCYSSLGVDLDNDEEINVVELLRRSKNLSVRDEYVEQVFQAFVRVGDFSFEKFQDTLASLSAEEELLAVGKTGAIPYSFLLNPRFFSLLNCCSLALRRTFACALTMAGETDMYKKIFRRKINFEDIKCLPFYAVRSDEGLRKCGDGCGMCHVCIRHITENDMVRTFLEKIDHRKLILPYFDLYNREEGLSISLRIFFENMARIVSFSRWAVMIFFLSKMSVSGVFLNAFEYFERTPWKLADVLDVTANVFEERDDEILYRRVSFMVETRIRENYRDYGYSFLFTDERRGDLDIGSIVDVLREIHEKNLRNFGNVEKENSSFDLSSASLFELRFETRYLSNDHFEEYIDEVVKMDFRKMRKTLNDNSFEVDMEFHTTDKIYVSTFGKFHSDLVSVGTSADGRRREGSAHGQLIRRSDLPSVRGLTSLIGGGVLVEERVFIEYLTPHLLSLCTSEALHHCARDDSIAMDTRIFRNVSFESNMCVVRGASRGVNFVLSGFFFSQNLVVVPAHGLKGREDTETFCVSYKVCQSHAVVSHAQLYSLRSGWDIAILKLTNQRRKSSSQIGALKNSDCPPVDCSGLKLRQILDNGDVRDWECRGKSTVCNTTDFLYISDRFEAGMSGSVLHDGIYAYAFYAGCARVMCDNRKVKVSVFVPLMLCGELLKDTITLEAKAQL